jgi:predicted ester cyclase
VPFLSFVAMASSPGTDIKVFATGLAAGICGERPSRRHSLNSQRPCWASFRTLQFKRGLPGSRGCSLAVDGSELTRRCKVEAQARETERSKAVIRRFVEEVQNEKNWDVYDELNDPDFFNHSAPPGMTDREGSKQYLGGFLNGFPDSHFTIDDMIAEGDQVVTKKTFRGMHTGDFAGIPPTGKEVTLQFVDIMRVRDGRITEHWLCMDQLSFMQQLGVVSA